MNNVIGRQFKYVVNISFTNMKSERGKEQELLLKLAEALLYICNQMSQIIKKFCLLAYKFF
jgi:hypothetical protein